MAIRYDKDERGVVTLTMDMPDRKANTLGAELAAALADAVARLEAEGGLTGVMLTSAKKDFLAGADIDEMYAWTDPAAVFAQAEAFKAVMRRFETLGKPTVAAMAGSALGGGYELALCCHRRIAVDDAKARIGLPETTLGLFPGGGGTQRLPRMIGIQAALPLILEGKRLKPKDALAAGLVDELAPDLNEAIARAKAWIAEHPESRQPWDETNFRWPGGPSVTPKNAMMWSVAPSMLNQKTRDCYPAPHAALAAVFEGGCVDFDTGCRIESRYFADIAVGSVAKNMLTAFWFQLRQIGKGESRPAEVPAWRASKVGILGAGMMGAGIAYAAARGGLDVVLKDVDRAAAERGKAHSETLLSKAVGKGRISAEAMAATLERIAPTDAAEDLAGCDLIIEAVFEDRALKAEVTREAEARLAEDATFATNTSTLPITGLAAASRRPQNFIGLHFFSPVDKMKLVEIIVGEQTGDTALARAFDFVQQIGKTPIVVNDSRGFYTSRVFSAYVLEGVALLREGQQPRAIESAGLAAGMPVGPLAVSDEVSLALMHRIMTQTRADGAAKPHPADAVIERMVVELDRPGKKAGRGFYDYPKDGPKRLWPGLREQWPPLGGALDQREMMDRLMFIQALEAARCLEEGVLRSVADANIGSIFGWGFPAFKGGALQFINDYGLAAFTARADALAAAHGARFTPSPGLRARAADDAVYK